MIKKTMVLKNKKNVILYLKISFPHPLVIKKKLFQLFSLKQLKKRNKQTKLIKNTFDEDDRCFLVLSGSSYKAEIQVDFSCFSDDENNSVESWFGRSGGENSLYYEQIEDDKFYLVTPELECFAESNKDSFIFDGRKYTI